MAKIHDKFVIELAEVIKGYGNDPDVDDPFYLSQFYRFYELPNIAVSRENFEKMRPVEPERKRGKWLLYAQRDGIETGSECSQCGYHIYIPPQYGHNFCPNCGADMRGNEDE